MPARKRGLRPKVKTRELCISCKKPIHGKAQTMRLQITHEDPKMIASAKKVGFTSANWRIGEEMHGPLHRQCFNQAILIWEITFHTRALSPRR